MIFGSESLPLQKKCDQAFQLVKPLLKKKKSKEKNPCAVIHVFLSNILRNHDFIRVFFFRKSKDACPPPSA